MQPKTIIHLADIHIRNLKRHAEYRHVFETLYSSIKKITKRDKQLPIIVVAGDIVHSKTEISPELVSMVNEFVVNLTALSELCVIIPGNHDANLNNSSRLDTLTPILQPIQEIHSNLWYLKDNGIYEYKNIDFAVMSLLDKPETYPKSDSCRANAIKIALFHGAMNASLVDSGVRLQTETKLSIFNGYDLALLGDIHKHQFLNPECTIAYPSSLIQQNFGEEFNRHGFIEWDLDSKTPKFHNLSNPYGYFTIEIDQNTVINEIPLLTKKNRVRVKASRTDMASVKEIVNSIAAEYKLPVDEITINQSHLSIDQQSVAEKLVEGDLRNINVQQQLLENHLASKGINNEQIKRVKDIHKQTMIEVEVGEYIPNTNWKPIRFEFSNMFSYGEDNVVDFSMLSGLYGVFGSNATGKSSIFDAWCFCMFDECSRTYKADRIMNVNKSSFKCKGEQLRSCGISFSHWFMNVIWQSKFICRLLLSCLRSPHYLFSLIS